MGTDLAIYSKRIWIDKSFQPATVFIKNGKISHLQAGKPDGLASPIIDAGTDVVMPGLIDPHVHINEPGRTDWEGFETATKAAAAGGITSLVDMPLNSSPVTTNQDAFLKKTKSSKNKLHVNCGFWGGIVPENSDNLEGLLESGILGIKAFLVDSGLDEFPNVAESDLRKGLPSIAKKGLPLLVHCELEQANEDGLLLKKLPQSYAAWLLSRPKEWENRAIEMIIKLCREFHCRTHIVHLSSATALPMIEAARAEGLPLTVETCPHYLFFHSEDIPDADTRFKCAPPIREKANNEQLWNALESGLIDFIASDHSPAPPSLKHLETGDFEKAWGGIASLQFLLPLVWTAAKKRGVGLENMANWLTARPAKFLGFHQKKGKIAPGYDADLVIWNPEANFVVEEKTIEHRHKITPYLGQKLFGQVKQTYVGGFKVFEEGVFKNLNKGEFLFSRV